MFAHKPVPCPSSQCALARMAKTPSFHNSENKFANGCGRVIRALLTIEGSNPEHRGERGAKVLSIKSPSKTLCYTGCNLFLLC